MIDRVGRCIQSSGQLSADLLSLLSRLARRNLATFSHPKPLIGSRTDHVTRIQRPSRFLAASMIFFHGSTDAHWLPAAG
jgi:hypothetical protein